MHTESQLVFKGHYGHHDRVVKMHMINNVFVPALHQSTASLRPALFIMRSYKNYQGMCTIMSTERPITTGLTVPYHDISKLHRNSIVQAGK